MHSLVVSYLVSGTVVVHALLHDAAVIYTGDIPFPVKSPLQRNFEDSALKHIYRCLSLPFPSPEIRKIVKAADLKSCTAEVWTVCPENLRGLPEFQCRCPEAENLILEVLQDYDPIFVLDTGGKYVNLFLEMFESLRDLLHT
jgi:5'-deoxynucleotidase YfbR-like HD superfamily hydrolase